MRINSILKKTGFKTVAYNHKVTKITSDSRTCDNGSVFVAISGFQENGQKYIEEAIQKGAKTIITKSVVEEVAGINYIYVGNTRKALAQLAKVFYHDVSKKLKIIGIIGTNGKTTTSMLGYHFFNYVGYSSMVIGTSGVFCKGFKSDVHNTTPDILNLYQYFEMAHKKHIQYVFLEVSSVSIHQYRIFGIHFNVLIFTNFSQDHLDYHKTLEEYLACKVIPFTKLSNDATAIVNADDPNVEKIIQYTDAKVITYGFSNPCDFLGTINTVDEHGCSFYAKNLLFKSKLLGEFNLYNELAILALCDVYHLSYSSYADFLKHFSGVDGRMNRYVFNHKTIIIDYAHTFIATKKAIEEGAKLCQGTLYVLLGCGGNREKEKRGMIGAYLNEVPAEIILTSDNPRFENPNDIIADIRKPIEKQVEVIPDRKEALLSTLNKLQEKDVLLALGKGCEAYMDVQGKKVPYSDLEVLKEWEQNR